MNCDTSLCSRESGDSNLGYKGLGVHDRRVGEANRVYFPEGVSPPMKYHSVLVSQKSINTPVNSSPKDFQTLLTTGIAPKSIPVNFQTLICSVEDFLVKHSRLLESGEVSKIPEARCFSTLREYLKLKDLALYSLKTSRAYSITIKGKLLKSSFKRWKSWGMMCSGWYLTANFSEYPRTERGYSLSEVLEEQVDHKYYLSEDAIKRIFKSDRSRRDRNVLGLCVEEITKIAQMSLPAPIEQELMQTFQGELK